MRRRFHRVEMSTVDLGDRAEQSRLATGAGTQVEPPAVILAVERGKRECTGDELTAFVLDSGESVAYGLELARITAVEVDRLRRVEPLFAAGDDGQFLGRDLSGTRYEVHCRA